MYIYIYVFIIILLCYNIVYYNIARGLHYREVVVVGVVIAKGIIIVSVFKCVVRFLL